MRPAGICFVLSLFRGLAISLHPTLSHSEAEEGITGTREE
jgi:hypothetical protein